MLTVLDDLQIAGSGEHSFKNSPFPYQKIGSKAHKSGPHVNLFMLAFTRVLCGGYVVTKFDNREGTTGPKIFRNKLSAFMKAARQTPLDNGVGAAEFTPEIVLVSGDRAYGGEMIQAIEAKCQTVSGSIRAHSRNNKTTFTFNKKPSKAMEKKGITEIPVKGVQRTYVNLVKDKSTGRVHKDLALRPKNGSVVISKLSVHAHLHRLSNSYVIRMKDEATLRNAICGASIPNLENMIRAPILTVSAPTN